MARNKKKSPGRPKKEFISKKPRVKIKSWPGRPRKDQKNNQVPSEVVGFVKKAVDNSQKKDLIILLLFFLSFGLFVVSLYFTFMRDKKGEDIASLGISTITNVATGNIDYDKAGTKQGEDSAPKIIIETGDTPQATIQNFSSEEQTIRDFYQAVNDVDINALYKLTDAHLEQSNVFKTYYSKRRLSNFSQTILAPKIVVSSILEKATNSTNPNIKNFSYTLEYTLANIKQKFTEERSTILIKKGEDREIGKLMCETKGCSIMPFFNPEKYTK